MTYGRRFVVVALAFVAGNGWASPAAIAAETLSIVGTGDGVAVLERLAEVFHRNHTDIVIDVPKSIGSSGGIKAIGQDKQILGRVARPIQENEKSYGLSYHPFARIPVAFLVNKSVRIEDLSVEQVLGIFSGRLTDWQDVGDEPGHIRVVRRERGDSSLRILRQTFPGFDSLVITDNSMTTPTTQLTIDALTTIPRTIGFGPATEAIGTNLRLLVIGGRTPFDPTYWSHTTLALVFKEPLRSAAAKAFLEFLATPAAAQAIRTTGAIPY